VLVASLRKAAQCIGLTGPVSLVHDFFGFFLGTPAGTTVSVRRQVRLLQGKHFHLNVIRTAPFNDALLARIDIALQLARDVYAPVSVGIGRIQHYSVPQGGYEIIMSEGVAFDLWDSWSVPNDGIDAFIPYSLAGEPSGRSPEDGSCDKDDKDSGLLVGVLDNTSNLALGQALAHELGHYLGLGHEDDDGNNLMFPSVVNGGQLSGGQVGAIKLHCAMRAGCTT
jgi:hypothetical protein